MGKNDGKHGENGGTALVKTSDWFLSSPGRHTLRRLADDYVCCVRACVCRAHASVCVCVLCACVQRQPPALSNPLVTKMTAVRMITFDVVATALDSNVAHTGVPGEEENGKTIVGARP